HPPICSLSLHDALPIFDPMTLHSGSVAIRQWEEVGDCHISPICDEGECVRGRCVEPSWTSTWLSDLEDGEAQSDLEFDVWAIDDGRGLALRPQRALAPHRRYTLWLGAGLRDLAGNPLGASEIDLEPLRFDFSTAGAGSSGPEPRLRWPAPGARARPTNLDFVEVEYETEWRPSDTTGSLVLRDEQGEQ